MVFPARWLLLAACVTAVAASASTQEAAKGPQVVLLQIPAEKVVFPPIAASAMLSGTINVRVAVRPDGSVAEVTVFPQAGMAWDLLHGAAAEAAVHASFDCRGCTQPATAHTIAFVYSLDELDSANNPRPLEWKQTGDASSEVTVFARVPVLGPFGPPSKPSHVRAARCLWLWHCSKQAYVTPMM